MRVPSELTAYQLAHFAHMCFDPADFEALPLEEQQEVAMILNLAVSYCGSYAGLDMTQEQPDSVCYAVLAVGAEMLENRQMTQQYSTQNPTVMQILDMYSTNLLPSVPDSGTEDGSAGESGGEEP